MAKTRIEVCDSEDSARLRRAWLEERGYQVNEPSAQEIVVWNPINVGGQQQIATDGDGEVWMVAGTK